MTAALRTSFDAVIVGAGLAGSSAAIGLARAGWSVALVERQRFPRRKVCGECMSASNLPLLDGLGIGHAFSALAGPELRRVSLLLDDSAVTAELPRADCERHAWGRALGRETLDELLLNQARCVGATVFQPWTVQSLSGMPGAWHCELRSVDSAALLRLRAAVVIDAHGCWEDLPMDRPGRRLARGASDLFAFKAEFSASALPEGGIAVLALDGGYGGMVVADAGNTTVACCIRRDRLSQLRLAAPGLRAGDAVQAWLQQQNAGVRQALTGAVRKGQWLTAGPLNTGVHLRADDTIFKIGNAAGEAHPILGEGMSMALQSATLLTSVLLDPPGVSAAPAAHLQTRMQHQYAAAWRRAFAPRLRLAAVFAHLAMRPRSARALMSLARAWPGLLTQGARLGGKVRCAGWPGAAESAHPSAGPELQDTPNPPQKEPT